MNGQKLKSISRIFALPFKVSYNYTPIIAGLNITFVNSKTNLKVNSRTNALFKTVFTRHRIDDVAAITIEDTQYATFSVGDTAYEIIIAHKIIFANVTFIATSDRISSSNFFARL